MEAIETLDVQRLDGEFYGDFKKYLERHGCIWKETRSNLGQLLSVTLTFPRGTTVRRKGYSSEIRLGEYGVLIWTRPYGQNSIQVPYVLLGASPEGVDQPWLRWANTLDTASR